MEYGYIRTDTRMAEDRPGHFSQDMLDSPCQGTLRIASAWCAEQAEEEKNEPLSRRQSSFNQEGLSTFWDDTIAWRSAMDQFSGGRSLRDDGEVGCRCMKVSRRALKRIGAPWFALEWRPRMRASSGTLQVKNENRQVRCRFRVFVIGTGYKTPRTLPG